jgi:chromate transporter
LFNYRHSCFLKSIFIHSITAFGGQQGHVGMVLKTFVEKRNDLSQEELMELVSFSQILPGASSTQVLMLIGFKKGGLSLALLTLFVWIFPACFIMGLFSFYISNFGSHNLNTSFFKFIQPMAIGFLFYAALKAFRISINNRITFFILVISFFILVLFFKTPWVFPVLIVLAGITTNFSNKRFPSKKYVNVKHIRWSNLWLFVFIFVVSGFLSETARNKEWQNRKSFNLFENFYRFGSIVFGGADVLIPLMVDQYVARPTAPKFAESKQGIITIEKNELLTGAGFVRAIPGPVFSIASFAGGMALKDQGKLQQLLGCIIGSVAIFLPSALLILFFFPVWEFVKKYIVVVRSLEGINAVVVALMFAATVYLLNDFPFVSFSFINMLNIAVILSTVLMLSFIKLPPPFIVIFCLILGFIF